MVEGLFSGEAGGQQAACGHVFDGLDREVGIDGARTIADEQCVVHDFKRGSPDSIMRATWSAGLFANQVIVNSGQREEARNRRIVLVDAAVGDDDQGVAGFDG